jgi:hypothetical protein
VKNIRAGDKMFRIYLLHVECYIGEVETTIFEVLQSNLVVNELIEELVKGVFDE